MEKRIAIVGVGINGLLACKYAMEKSFNPIDFESKSSIGGVWTKTFPYYNQVMAYLKAYALHFNILP
ncbi:hypothetical protein CK203_050481 [Vitis vinifera]|uniref:Flavin-containing monooxygenase n=1 Tax=Vitis vinifera TaxID=29760 RepID=A0A438H1X3_VITVI|nr:hypothetical protein CK203_050481 [Vitis vinifera]